MGTALAASAAVSTDSTSAPATTTDHYGSNGASTTYGAKGSTVVRPGYQTSQGSMSNSNTAAIPGPSVSSGNPAGDNGPGGSGAAGGSGGAAGGGGTGAGR